MKAKLSKEGGGYDLYRIDEDGKRITFASTQDYKQKLSLKNCQAIECGYDLEELAFQSSTLDDVEHSDMYRHLAKKFFKEGFQKALEILGDKKFSEEDVVSFFKWAYQQIILEGSDETSIELLQKWKSLQQTEWDVEIIEEGDINQCDGCKSGHDVSDLGIHVYPNSTRGYMVCQANKYKKPKLDADGCLILKRV